MRGFVWQLSGRTGPGNVLPAWFIEVHSYIPDTQRPERATGCRDTRTYTRARAYTNETHEDLATSSGVLDVLISSGGAGPIWDMLPGSPAEVPTLPLEV